MGLLGKIPWLAYIISRLKQLNGLHSPSNFLTMSEGEECGEVGEQLQHQVAGVLLPYVQGLPERHPPSQLERIIKV